MADQTLAKYVNELRILTMLRMEGQATRADIARRLRLTPATITRLINGLVRRGLVADVPEPPSAGLLRERGRPGVSVALNPEGGYFLGVEIGVGLLRYALIDLCANAVNTMELRVSRSIAPESAQKTVADHLTQLNHDIRFHGKIHSLCVTVPGLVNGKGHVVNTPILGWRDVDLLTLIKDAVNLPTYVENNANAAAFGSIYTHPDISGACTVYLKIGTGCGGAAIVDGRLLRGSNGMAGEFGHIRVADKGPLCNCGQPGCLETFVGLRGLARSYYGTDALSDAEFAALPEVIVANAESGDRAAVEAIEQFRRYLSLGIISLVNIFNPTTVMLGGSSRPVIAKCLAEIQQIVADSIVFGMTVPDIKMSAHGNLECVIGAATVAHHHAFDIAWNDLTNHKDGS